MILAGIAHVLVANGWRCNPISFESDAIGTDARHLSCCSPVTIYILESLQRKLLLLPCDRLCAMLSIGRQF